MLQCLRLPRKGVKYEMQVNARKLEIDVHTAFDL
jgi:hypothetical protein